MKLFAFAALGFVLATSGASLAAQCVVDGVGGYSATQTIGAGNLITTLCGHTISGSSGNCTLNMAQDESIASGSCVTLGGQTILNMNSHSITCTASSGACGTAITASNGPSGSNKVAGPGTIDGPWTTGATHGSGPFVDTIQDVTVALTYPSAATWGIRNFKSNTRVVVTGATEKGVELANAGDSLQDSIVANNFGGHGWGVISAAAVDISGSLIIGNTINVSGVGTASVDVTDSTFRDAGTCNFQQCLPTCTCTDAAIDFHGINFIDDTILQ
jgi:hypothetical protein